MRSLLVSFGVFAVVAPVLVLFWTIILGPVLEPAWPALGDAATPVGVALLAVALGSGLVAYGALLRKLKVPLPFGLVPIALTVAGLWLIVSSLRFGF